MNRHVSGIRSVPGTPAAGSGRMAPRATSPLMFPLLVLLSTTALPIAANADPATAAASAVRNAGKVKGAFNLWRGKGKGDLSLCREEGYVVPYL